MPRTRKLSLSVKHKSSGDARFNQYLTLDHSRLVSNEVFVKFLLQHSASLYVSITPVWTSFT